MSTVAYRSGILASDTLAVAGTLHRKFSKLFVLVDSVVGVTGNTADAMTFVDWCRAGYDLNAVPTFVMYRGDNDAPDIQALVYRTSGLWIWTEHFQRSPVIDEFFAIGSGAMAAMAAMHMGANAPEAIEVASKVDLHTGGEIETAGLDGYGRRI